MKFIHLGDLHMGKSLGDFDLIKDQEYILDQILNIAETRQVDAILIAGDVYDKAIPSEAAVRLFNNFINKVVTKGFKVFVISGNHDSDERLNFGSELFESKGVVISAIYDGILHHKTLTKGDEEVNVYMMPFIKASQVRHFYPDEKIENYDDAIRVAIDKSNIDFSKNNILIAHQFVGGNGEDVRIAGSEGPSVKAVGLVEMVGSKVFDGFNYVALGHIHSAQKIGREEVRYCGSPLKYAVDEADSEKFVPVVTVDKDGRTEIEQVKLVPMRDLRHIKGKMEQLLSEENITAPDDYIYATLTDEDIINDVMGIFQQYYPNTVKIDYDNSHSKEIADFDFSDIVENKSFNELIGDFYRKMYGCDMSEEEMAVMLEVAKEAKVINEAD